MLLLWLFVASTKNKDGRSTMPRYGRGARSIAQGLAAVGEWQLWGPLPETTNRSLAICTQIFWNPVIENALVDVQNGPLEYF